MVMDTLGFEPRAFRMRSGCDTTTPCAQLRLALPGMYQQEVHVFRARDSCRRRSIPRRLPADHVLARHLTAIRQRQRQTPKEPRRAHLAQASDYVKAWVCDVDCPPTADRGPSGPGWTRLALRPPLWVDQPVPGLIALGALWRRARQALNTARAARLVADVPPGCRKRAPTTRATHGLLTGLGGLWLARRDVLSLSPAIWQGNA
jgi:hypothetical protein